MPREILFRAKATTGEGWVYGYYRHVLRGKYDSHKIYDPITNVEHDVEGETVSQFIGILDKKQNKIFYGDIVDIIHPCWQAKCLVGFINGSFVFTSLDLIDKGSIVTTWSFMKEKWKVEIIGNSIDNPEILK